MKVVFIIGLLFGIYRIYVGTELAHTFQGVLVILCNLVALGVYYMDGEID